MKKSMILWHDLFVERASYPVPSTHHQTLLSKTIFEHCLDYSQVASIALASKSIQNSSLSPNFAFNIVIDETSLDLFETVFHPSTSLPFQFVPELSWSCDFQLLQQLVHSTEYFTKSLRSLTLYTDGVSEFLSFLSESPHETESPAIVFSALEKLDLNCCEIREDDIDILESVTYFPQMQSISICTIDENVALKSLKLHHLTSLMANGGDRFLREIATSTPSKLHKLALNAAVSQVSDEGLANLESLQQSLRSLSLTCATDITWNGLKHVASLANLTSLNLASTIICSDVDWETLLSSFPNLIHLDLSYCKVSGSAFDHFSKLQNLTTLILNSAYNMQPGISGHDLKKVASLRRLTKLSAREVIEVNDDVLSEWATKLKDLKELNVQGCDNIRFHNLPVFSALTRLDFYCRPDINDEDVASIAVSFPNLTAFDLILSGNQAGITDVGVKSIVSLSSLRTLSLVCSGITDQGLKLILTRLPLLKILRVQFTDITDEVFKECVDDIRKKLAYLDISYCAKVTAKTVNLLRSSCRHLRLVSYLEFAAKQESGCRCVLQ